MTARPISGLRSPPSGSGKEARSLAAAAPHPARPRGSSPRSIVLGLCLALTLMGLENPTAPGKDPDASGPTPEARAVAFLSREVPRWSRENRCFSCHNNGDAARALYEASRAGFRVPAEALADTTDWLARPSGWEHNGGDGPFSDKRLARVAFTTALASATRAGWTRDRAALHLAARRLAQDQAEDGSWTLEGEEAPGSPAAYGRALATFLAREGLAADDPVRFRSAVDRADDWLMRRPADAIERASVVLMATASIPGTESAIRRREALALLRRTQSVDGGWGPHETSPPEVFDTALALLGLARCGDTLSADRVRRMIARGRAFLIAEQRDDGSWGETTRPAGATSYAQRISTTGWATLALLATRDAAPR